MSKRRLSVFLALAALFLTSCSPSQSSSSADGVTLTMMGRKSDLEKSYMTAVIDRYEAATGNRLELISYEDAEFEAEAAQRFAMGDVPDIFLHFHNADLAAFDVDGNFRYLDDESWVDDLTDSARSYCTDSDGHLLGLPFWESSVSGCYYNKTLLDSMGLSPATTQTEFDTLCQALADTGYTPICWPGDGCTWMGQFGLDPIFADDPALLQRLNANEITYADIPAVRDMVQWIADAADNGWFGSAPLQTGWDDIGPALSSGDAVMTFIWDTWFSTDFHPDGTYTPDDFALMPIFMNTAAGGTYEGGNLNMMMVNKNSAHLQDALDLLAFCADSENYNIAFDGISTVSCFKGQTTNIQSRMVTDAQSSIAKNERVSTAASRIVGYSADDVASALNDLISGRTDVDGCVALLDRYRMTNAGWLQ